MHNNIVSRLCTGFTYGISFQNDLWYVFQNTGRYGRIISFELKIDKNECYKFDYKKFNYLGLSAGIHQIDYYNGVLYATDTYNNRLIIFKDKEKEYFYPNGKLKDGRRSINYNHFNSIYFNKNKLYMIAHNETVKSKKTSEIYVFSLSKNHELNFSQLISTDAKNAHNISILNERFIYCDTMDGIVMLGEDVFFENKSFLTRGLSITKECIAIGGSAFAKREDRLNKDSMVWILDYNGNQKATIELNGIGQVNEIRCLTGDLALSDSSKIMTYN